MLECQQLTKRFDERLALDALDLRVGGGEIFCLLGANGAGKTTTIDLATHVPYPFDWTLVDVDQRWSVLFNRRRVCFRETSLKLA